MEQKYFLLLYIFFIFSRLETRKTHVLAVMPRYKDCSSARNGSHVSSATVGSISFFLSEGSQVLLACSHNILGLSGHKSSVGVGHQTGVAESGGVAGGRDDGSVGVGHEAAIAVPAVAVPGTVPGAVPGTCVSVSTCQTCDTCGTSTSSQKGTSGTSSQEGTTSTSQQVRTTSRGSGSKSQSSTCSNSNTGSGSSSSSGSGSSSGDDSWGNRGNGGNGGNWGGGWDSSASWDVEEGESPGVSGSGGGILGGDGAGLKGTSVAHAIAVPEESSNPRAPGLAVSEL